MPEKETKNTPVREAIPDLTLRSEQVQEILAAPPSWMLKWGITVIFSLILMLLFFAWLIKYPDVIVGQVKITTTKPPVQQISYTSGKIVSLNKSDNQKVKKDETIATIENLLTVNNSQVLKQYVDSVGQGMKQPDKPLPLNESLGVIGELQPDFNKLTSFVKSYNRIITDPFFEKSLNNINAQISHYQRLVTLSSNQIFLSKKDLTNAVTRFQANKQLYENGAIPKLDYITEETKYILAQRAVDDIEKVKIQNEISLSDFDKQKNDLRFQHDDRLFQTAYSIYEELAAIKNQLQQWEQRYVIKAPFNGTVSYSSSWAVDKYVKQGDVLFTVVPENQEYIGLVIAPAVNFGKIKTGQKVLMRMDNYAYNELGELTGKIKSITLAPGADNNYRVEVLLDNGLTSTFKKQFEYKPEMTGSAQIITEDLSFLERIFYKFKQLLAR